MYANPNLWRAILLQVAVFTLLLLAAVSIPAWV